MGNVAALFLFLLSFQIAKIFESCVYKTFVKGDDKKRHPVAINPIAK